MHTDNSDITSNGTPRVTVVMGLYNCESTLQQAVESIINQTYRHWELIMCDDASTDGTYQLACRLAEKDTRIKVLQNRQNMGCNMVLNRCMPHIEVNPETFEVFINGQRADVPPAKEFALGQMYWFS